MLKHSLDEQSMKDDNKFDVQDDVVMSMKKYVSRNPENQLSSRTKLPEKCHI